MMKMRTYRITDINTGFVIAKGMDLCTALVLVEGLMNKFYEDKNIGYTIEREDD